MTSNPKPEAGSEARLCTHDIEFLHKGPSGVIECELCAATREQETVVALEHSRNCPERFRWDEECTCGLEFRIQLQTEREMHQAWRKRGEEAEQREAKLREALSWIAAQRDLFFAECSQAEEIIVRAKEALRELPAPQPSSPTPEAALPSVDAIRAWQWWFSLSVTERLNHVKALYLRTYKPEGKRGEK